MYNTTCLKTTLDSQQSVLLGQNASFADGRFEIDETAITECAIAAQNGGLVEEGIPYVAGNTLWAVYQVICGSFIQHVARLSMHILNVFDFLKYSYILVHRCHCSAKYT